MGELNILRLALISAVLAASVNAIPQATAVPAHGLPLDLNTATFAQLRALPGMGDEYARRIIRNRPYTAKNQLSTRGILPQTVYLEIAPFVVARRVSASSTK
jgi:competence protein ComEA